MRIPGLENLQPLGQGGFATVYRAHQVQLGRDVAVKIDNRVLAGERDRRRFLREAHAAARLSGHPNVVAVHDANITPEGMPYIVMELCTGGSLHDVLKKQGPLPAERVRQLGIALADALAAAHAEGVLHRDIKPANILVDRYGTAKLADFGLAALLDAAGDSTVTRDALSPSYAPPEAFAMAAPTVTGDVYALAATLYDLLAGKPPRPVPWPIESFDHLGEVLRRPVPPVPGVPEDFHNALARALHPDVSARTPTAARLRDELRGAVSTSPPPVAYAPATPAPPAKGKQWVAVVAAVAVVLALGGGAWWLNSRDGTAANAGPTANSPSSQPKASEQPQTPPPYLKACATGFCVEESSCYRGTVSIGGQAATARRIGDCSQEHYWEAFAGGWLSGKIPKVDPDELAATPEVAGVCSREAMAANTRPNVDTAGWQVVAIGFEDEDRNYFHCLASPREGGETTTSAFGSDR
ncbi:serine/threonine-protein kinase [Umezawaea sp. Da 62-37]|uniref:serine/threonine-protein kinase n=1 Tax=Umezawaea sp. Da 62-37 TaxID=3075927 RepID=UPI0028F6C811|nr:serine/threonine-protein kinase [Umezawaea sp. Da 62-37]WNV90746.1 serine/threonine-protein kinase [Umezawaea sp. Da 62-37]